MPPETQKQKTCFVVLGAMSVMCIILAAIFNTTSQNRLNNTIQKMANDVRNLAGPASARKDGSVDQILSAAAIKLLQQDAQIHGLQDEMTRISHPADALYIDGSTVGRVEGGTTIGNRTISFSVIAAGEKGINFDSPLTYQNMILTCQRPSSSGQSGHFGIQETYYPNVQCYIDK